MTTHEKILDEALTLFSETGDAYVCGGDIADRVGIKAPSLYKHYKSKKAIFEAIIDEMNRRFAEQAKAMQINGTDAAADAGIYKTLPEDQLLKLGREFFLYYLHDDYNRKFRKMLTLEQFQNQELAKVYSKLYVDDPLSYQGMLFGFMVTAGVLKTDNVRVMTLHFYSPIYFMLTICDREPEREPEMLKLLDEHITQFDRLYGRNK